MAPKYTEAITPGTCEYCLIRQNGLVDVIKDPSMGGYPGLFGGP